MEIDDAPTVLNSIRTGQYDEDLSKISEECHQRQRLIRLTKASLIRPGDIVKFVRGRPQYLIGHTAKVSRVMHSWCMVQLQQDVGKFQAHVDIRTPMTIIEKC